MITSHILEDKWRVQRDLDEQAGHDPSRYLALIHKAQETQERYKVRLRYSEAEESALAEATEEA